MSAESQKNPQPPDLNAAKKAAVLGQDQPARTPAKTKIMMGVALAALVALGGAYVFSNQADTVAGPALAGAAGAPAAQDGLITFAVQDFADGKARHYSLHTPGGLTVRYFILKSADGVIRAAFDACDVCWPANKGYSQDGDVMVCNNCGRRFASTQINEVKGGCNPAPLERQVADDKLIIKVADILAGSGYFNFKKP